MALYDCSSFVFIPTLPLPVDPLVDSFRKARAILDRAPVPKDLILWTPNGLRTVGESD